MGGFRSRESNQKVNRVVVVPLFILLFRLHCVVSRPAQGNRSCNGLIGKQQCYKNARGWGRAHVREACAPPNVHLAGSYSNHLIWRRSQVARHSTTSVRHGLLLSDEYCGLDLFKRWLVGSRLKYLIIFLNTSIYFINIFQCFMWNCYVFLAFTFKEIYFCLHIFG